jgi:hypothetical protein
MLVTLISLMLAMPARAETSGQFAGHVAGGVLGAGVGYATGFFLPFAITTCSSDRCGEGLGEAITGALLSGPMLGAVGALGGVVVAHGAQRGADLPVLATAVGVAGLGASGLALALAHEDGGSPPLALIGATTVLAGAPVLATVVSERTRVAAVPMGLGAVALVGAF